MATNLELFRLPHREAFNELVIEKLMEGVDIGVFSIGGPEHIRMTPKGSLTQVSLTVNPALSGVELWPYVGGSTPFTYTRFRAQDFFANKDMTFTVDFPIYLSQIMGLILRRHLLRIDQDEYENYMVSENLEGQLNVAVLPGSYRMAGVIPLTLILRVKPLLEVILATSLGAIPGPAPDTVERPAREFIMEQVNLLNAERLGDHPLQPDGSVGFRDFIPGANGAASFLLRMLPDNKYYNGEVTVTYTRRRLSESFPYPYPTITSTALTTSGLALELGAEHGVYIRMEDVIDDPLTTEPGTHYVMIYAAEGSENYHGEMTIELIRT